MSVALNSTVCCTSSVTTDFKAGSSRVRLDKDFLRECPHPLE